MKIPGKIFTCILLSSFVLIQSQALGTLFEKSDCSALNLFNLVKDDSNTNFKPQKQYAELNHRSQESEFQWKHNYSQTLVMKMLLSVVNKDGSSNVVCDLDKALSIIQKTDVITLGVPKIIYMVGWQYNGHDDKYPAFFEVNPALKRPQDATALKSLNWLIKEAKKYHTTVSLHINMTDAYENSPLWKEYVDKDMLSKNADGTLKVVGFYNNRNTYSVNYKHEWENGYSKMRIDKLLDLIPEIKEAGTIHLDAWIARNSEGHFETNIMEAEYQKKVCNYWYSKGIDVTGEWVMDYMTGMVPFAWHFNNRTIDDYLKIPATIYTGSDLNPDLKNSDFGFRFLFGTSMYGENLFPNGRNRVTDENWVSKFINEFYLNCPQYFFLNKQKRLSVEGNGNNRIAYFTNDVKVSLADSTVTQKSLILRKKNIIFFPAVWLKDNSYVAYSPISQGKSTFVIPTEWKGVKKISIMEVTNNGLINHRILSIKKQNILIDLEGNKPLLLTPETEAGTIRDTLQVNKSHTEQTSIDRQPVTVIDFGALPNDTINDREAIQQALNYCHIHKIKKLIIPKGKYIIRDEKAVQLMNEYMDGKMGKNPESIIYAPYYPYARGLNFNDINDLDVEATGAVLSVQGWMEPVSLENCKSIRIKGLTIDYETMPHSEGEVIGEKADYFDVKFSNEFPVKSDMIMPRIMFWDLAKNRLLGNSIYHPKKNELIAPQILRIWATHPSNITGKIALINHTFHFRPAILIHEASNTILEQVTIHAQPGMGIVGHRSNNILMKGLRIVPRPGFYQSTNTDATHFTSCKGTIRFDGCMIEGQGDDATNVHGYYQVIRERIADKSYSIQMEKEWGTHAMVLDFPDKGDTLELVSKKTLKVFDTYIVAKVDTFPREWKTEVELDRPLPTDIESYYLIDVTRLPRLEFVNSYVGSHLARAVLVKTRNVLIENCTMKESTGTAIHIGAEGDWREGPGSKNVIIRNNRILRCGRGDGTNDNACAIAINVKAPDVTVSGIHKNIIIEGNLIEGENAEYGISVSGAENVNIRNNIFSGCKLPLKIRYSTGIHFENNYNEKSKLKDIL